MPIDPFSSLAGLLTIIQMTVTASAQAKSHKHNVAALTRRIKLLVPLLEEVQEREMTEAQLNSFENLQLAIERARDLIVKCGERSKMYMMFRGTGIIERFKDVSLDLDRCLNALPLVNLKVSDKIREQVDSVSDQLRKAKYTIDEMDQKLSSDIALVLKEQREGLEANQALMRQLAEKLELNSHDKVVAETRALEIEKEEVRAEKNRQEEAYISQIINLLSVMDANQEAGPSGSYDEPPANRRSSSSLRMTLAPVPPEEFKCPLSLELMAEPVVIASGQTFERAYIRRWWSQGHRTCPITNLPLNNLELISNYSLKRMISDWCETNGQSQPEAPVLSPPHSPSLRFMTEDERSPFGKAPDEEPFEETWRSGPMTIPDRGKGAEEADFGSCKGKYVEDPSSRMRAGKYADISRRKPGFEGLRDPSLGAGIASGVGIAYEQSARLPSEFVREPVLNVVSGEVNPNPPVNQLVSPSRPQSKRTIRNSMPGSGSARVVPERSSTESEEGYEGKGMSTSMSTEFKPPKPTGAATKGDSSQPGHRRNSSAPLSEVAAEQVHPYRGEDSEDLSGFNYGPPPVPHNHSSAINPRPAITPAVSTERPIRYAQPLPIKVGPAGAEDTNAARHEASDHATPRFAPPSPIRSEVPIGSTPTGHALRQGSLNNPAVVLDIREPMADPKRHVTNAELQTLTRELRSCKPELVKAATGDLRQLAKFSMENRKAIATAGVIPDLIGLLDHKDPKTQENAVTALLNLSIHDGNKAIIAHDGAIPRLVEVLQGGSQEAKENAAATLFSLSVLEECKLQIGAEAGAILGLVDLLRTGSALGRKDATTALFNLSICHENKSRIVRNGAVGPLIQLIKDQALQEKVVAVLANLTTVGEGRLAITEALGIKALVAVTERGTPRSRENAAAALLQLCINSGRHTADIYQEGVIPSLMSLQQTGTPRAKEKAKALLRHFRDNLQDTVQP